MDDRAEQIAKAFTRIKGADEGAWDSLHRLISGAFNSKINRPRFSVPVRIDDDDVSVAIYIRTLETKAAAVPALVALVLNARSALAQMSSTALRLDGGQTNSFTDSVDAWCDYADELKLTDGEQLVWKAAGSPTEWLLPAQPDSYVRRDADSWAPVAEDTREYDERNEAEHGEA